MEDRLMKWPRIRLWYLTPLVLSMLVLHGCDETAQEPITEVNPTAKPDFIVSPDTLDIIDTDPTGEIFLSTDGPGELAWHVTAHPGWMTISPDSGEVGESVQKLTVTADPVGLDPVIYSGTVELISENGEDDVHVRFSVEAHAVVELSVDDLEFGQDVTEASFTITNAGTGLLLWQIETDDDWMSFLPDSGSLAIDETREVDVTVDREGHDPGTVTGTFTISSNALGGDVTVPVEMVVPTGPIMAVPDTMFAFDHFTENDSIKIMSVGHETLVWSMSVDEDFIELGATNGSIDAGLSDDIAMTVDRTDLDTDTHTATVTITTDHGQTQDIHISVQHFDDKKWHLEHRVVDSEYDRNNDVIITVSEYPNQLHVIDFEAQTIQSVDLVLPPLCVSLRADGAYAAVGHDGYFSYVDLVTPVLVSTYAVTTVAVDIVLASNGWVYVLPLEDQWEEIRCVDLATGEETLSTGNQIYDGTRAILHPSGDYIYGATNGLSPSDFEKYDIRGDTADYMYDSPYHGDFPFLGNIWVSDDGGRLIARSGRVFRAATVEEDDMVYAGSLAGMTRVEWVEHSTAAARVYAFTQEDEGAESPPGYEVRVYTSDFLGILGSAALTQFMVPVEPGIGEFFNSVGRFIFVNSAGTRVYALVQAEEESGMADDWAIEAFNVADLP